jgi:mono/diheme cytochrome c family protein
MNDMSRSAKLVALAVVLVALAAAGWRSLRSTDPTDFAGGKRVDLATFQGPRPSGVPSALAGADLVARGEYLTRAADCAACHTAPGGKPFAGGLAFKLPMIGTLYSTNITPDKDTGIGGWTDEDFVRALHDGIDKEGEHLYPAFPYTSYTLMTGDDALAIKAYLFSLKPIDYRPPADDVAFPFNQRYLMTFWNLLFKPGHRFEPNADQPADWNRGAYLVEALGHCGDCHTPRNLLYGLKSSQKFAGAVIQGWKAYNITPDPKWGIGAWSVAQVGGYLSQGHAEGHSSASGPMAEVVDNSLRLLTDDDIAAVTTYLKSVPAVSDAGGAAAVQTPSATEQIAGSGRSSAGSQPLGLRIFEGACASCHSFDGAGVIFSNASLLGSRSVNDPAGTNATQAILQGTHLHTSLGKIFMPEFGNGYSDAEIAAVVNYVTGRFGTTASALTPDEVTQRRQED